MYRQLWQNTEHEVSFSLSQSLNNELAIMAEEKEASTTTCSFASFEDLFTVYLWTETLLNHLKVVFKVVVESFHEEFILMKLYFDIVFNNCSILILLSPSCCISIVSSVVLNIVIIAQII